MCRGVSHRDTFALAAGIHTRLSLMRAGVWPEAVQNFFQSKFKGTHLIYGEWYIHVYTIMFQICFEHRFCVIRKKS